MLTTSPGMFVRAAEYFVSGGKLFVSEELKERLDA
jgi:hypothetical protein